MRKVLIVDDDEDIRRSVGRLLRLGGFEVALALSGEDCLAALRGGFQGVVLMDIMMPGLTGWGTMRAMVKENLMGGVLVCMLTAKSSPGADGEGLEPFAFDYLPKPFDNTALLQCVHNAMGFLAA